MPGGLMQLAVYGTQDIFLTGSPQITFFKIIYRRHTNFAMESVQQHLVSMTNFGQEMISVIDKLGDLMGSVYLEIDLPKVDLVKNPSHWTTDQLHAKQQLEQIQRICAVVNDYLSKNVTIIRKVESMLKIHNIDLNDLQLVPMFDLQEARIRLKEYLASSPDLDHIQEFQGLKIDLQQGMQSFDIGLVLHSVLSTNLDPETKRMQLQRFIAQTLYPMMKDFYMKFHNVWHSRQRTLQSFSEGRHCERYKFAWVEEVGHSIIEKIDVKIGNQIIDSHTGDWLILFNKLFTPPHHKSNYNQMVGNVPELTTFDDKPKVSRKLIIPFQFWFCRYTGLAIPLVALRYHDVMFNIKLKDLSKLCYVEDDAQLVDISNIQSRYNINITDAKLYVDYIFLDTTERQRFAESTHEYLIEIVQYNEFSPDRASNGNQVHLSFSHPTKFVVWFAQEMAYRENNDGHRKCLWNNFSTSDSSAHTMQSTYLRLNSYDRTDSDVKFFNYVQPYLHFADSVPNGLNIYSFAAKPMEHQPSGSINLSRIADFSIGYRFEEGFGVEGEQYMAAYAMSYNVLRIMGGMGGLAFV